MKTLILIIGIWFGLHTQVQAHGYHHYHHRHCVSHHTYRVHTMVSGVGIGLGHMLDSMGGRPHAWCGWYMRQKLGVRDPAYNLAANWAHYGRSAGGPGDGVIVVWRHHVGLIRGRAGNGLWIVESGNDGHAVRTRARSLAGAIAFREP